MSDTSAKARIAAFLGRVVAFTAGAGTALFTTGPALFADGEFRERLFVLGFAVAAFALLGLVAGLVSPARWASGALWLWAGSVPVAGFFAIDGIGRYPFMLLAAGFLVGDLAAALFGAWTGSVARLRRASS